MSTILDALRKLQRDRAAQQPSRDLRGSVTDEIPFPRPSRARSGRGRLALAGVGALLLALAGGGAWWFLGRAPAGESLEVAGEEGRPPTEEELLALDREIEDAAAMDQATAAEPEAPAPVAAPPAGMEPAPAAPPDAPVDPAVEAAAERARLEAAQAEALAAANAQRAAEAEAAARAAAAAAPPAPEVIPPAPPEAPVTPPALRSDTTTELAGEAVEAPKPKAKAKPKPKPKPVAKKKEPEPREIARAEEPEPYQAAESLAHAEFPPVRVDSIRWHPISERRVASLRFEQQNVSDAHEGDIVAGVLVYRIDPGSVELRVGSTSRVIRPVP